MSYIFTFLLGFSAGVVSSLILFAIILAIVKFNEVQKEKDFI